MKRMTKDDKTMMDVGIEVLSCEAVYLDEQKWDEWLALYAADCEYWVPSWKNEEQLTNNPQAELSHIYYANRAGLEDRIVRIRSKRSPASTPMPRTSHLNSGFMLLEKPSPEKIRLRSNWACNVFFPRMRESHAFFGRAEYEIVQVNGDWLIQKKKTILQNDYIPTMLDVYCI